METNQSNITTESGAVAGRDITSYNYNITPRKGHYLLQKLRNGIEPSEEKFLKELEHLMSKRTDEEIIGLEKKLIQGNRQDLLEYAFEEKERYYKKLLSCSTLEIEQELHLYLLLEVRSRFKVVYSKIHRGRSIDEVNLEIEKMVDEIYCQLEDDPINLYRNGIDGMIYFLTGNCHIKWH